MKKVFYLILFILYTTAVTAATLAPAKFLSNSPFNIWDKLMHALSFGIWSALFYGYKHFFKGSDSQKNVWTSITLGSIYGILIEYLQLILPINRSFEYLDMVADVIGAVAFTLLLHFAIRTRKSALESV